MQKFLMIIVVELMSFLKKEKVTQLGPEFLFLFLFLFIYFFFKSRSWTTFRMDMNKFLCFERLI